MALPADELVRPGSPARAGVIRSQSRSRSGSPQGSVSGASGVSYRALSKVVHADAAQLRRLEETVSRTVDEVREVQLQRELLRARGEAEGLRRELREAVAAHRAELAERLNDLRRRQREEGAEISAELRDVKSERNRLEQEVDLLRMQMADMQRAADQQQRDLEAAKTRELADLAAKLDFESGNGAAPAKQDQPTGGQSGDHVRYREMKMQNAALMGRLAVLERYNQRSQSDQVDALKEEVDALREERDSAKEELAALRAQLKSVDGLRGERIAAMEETIRELQRSASEAQKKSTLLVCDDRTSFLEGRVCTLQDAVRKLKDGRDKYMSELDISGYDQMEEAELEAKKARADRREALSLVDSMQQELRRLRAAESSSSRLYQCGRDFDTEVQRLVDKASRPGKQYYGVP
eukprot:TRINITY_DN46733_c0_g1_i1.p1 TRINITY_DN46733_c0_g1~~TRINITY_DN46733_c0_g1_i1.p1  ORF type:complete len:409 (+),score=140.47 TRINITY_DN46733_c0_g1_i1:70-1296(+)